MKKQIPVKIKNDIIKYTSLLKKEGFDDVKIILFGSIAKGTFDKYSDIDLAVISRKFGKNYNRELIKLMTLAHKINQPIGPLPLNPKDLDDKYNALANEINKYGVKIK